MELICPFADQRFKHVSRGVYGKGYPKGAVVHYTAGQCDTEQDAIDSIMWGKDEGLAFFMIGPTGVIYQTLPLNQWGQHCGQSQWPGLGTSLSSQLVGIEMACAGFLDRDGKAWFGKQYHKDDFRFVSSSEFPSGNYKKYTMAQENSLVMLLRWLHQNCPEVFSFDYVLGHHEVSPNRKNDPGGSLSCSMSELRAQLKGFPIAAKPSVEKPVEKPVEIKPEYPPLKPQKSIWQIILDLIAKIFS